jgi:hypothetical protein
VLLARLYLRFFREERTSIVLEGLAGAFEYHQGVPLEVVMDNMSQAVLGRIGPERELRGPSRARGRASRASQPPAAFFAQFLTTAPLSLLLGERGPAGLPLSFQVFPPSKPIRGRC